ncbi:MAG: divergent polysaccharide deacetylase family protein [Alphaproteobacteria bacterium]
MTSKPSPGEQAQTSRFWIALPLVLSLVAAAASGLAVWLYVEGSEEGEGVAGRGPAVSLPMPPLASVPAALLESTTAPAESAPAAPAQLEVPAPDEPAPERAEAGPPTASPADRKAEQPIRTPAPPLPPQLASLPPTADALPPAPDPELIEETPLGPLPRISVDGRVPWQVYARPFDRDDRRPRVAVVLSSLGLSSAATEAAIQGLPGGVTLAFQPYARNLQHWIQLSRAAGHEVILNLPMEPLDYPDSDPGPQALFTALSPEENIERLHWALSRVTGYVGVTNHMGSRFTGSSEAMVPIVEALRRRGLLFLDSRTTASSIAASLAKRQGVPRAINDRFIDADEISRDSIDAHLVDVERIAQEVGVSVVIGQPYPVTIERLRVWLDGLEERGIVLAPVSAVVDLQADR